MRNILPATLAVLTALAAPLRAAGPAFQDLLADSGGAIDTPMPEIPPARADGTVDAVQFLPPNNSEPGFDWSPQRKSQEDFFYIGNNATFLKVSEAQSSDLADGTGRCALSPNTLYKAAAKPGFFGEHMTVVLGQPLPGCQFTRGYIYSPHVSSSSAGGFWELPRGIKAFLDTLAYAEGTDQSYNYIFTHATFSSYAGHPRKRKCAGRLCSDAAGRYQFLSSTWDGLAPDLGLTDFTPPSQDKAVVELIRRAGAYGNVSKAGVYKNFTAALSKLNSIWASLPGSPYGQPTHSTAQLWKVYKAALAKY